MFDGAYVMPVGGIQDTEAGVLSRAYLTIVSSLKIMLKVGVCQVSDELQNVAMVGA